MPFLTREKLGVPHDALYWRFGEQMAIRHGDFKLVRYDANADSQVRKGKANVTETKLYNLGNDIGESKDLAASMPGKVKELQAAWDVWNQANVKPLWGSGQGDEGAESGGQKKKRGKESKND
jgi:arylsulfatase A-like enzyme